MQTTISKKRRDQYVALTRLAFIALGSLVLSACVAGGSSLNSDRIERTFGSYGVEVIQQSGERRVSSLYSESGAERITRTYAVVEFLSESQRAYADVHSRILDGASIGVAFRRAGWAIEKQNLFIGELEVPASYAGIGDRMRVGLPATLGTHQYLFVVSRDERRYDYAMITEIHHPDYLTTEDLREIYGEILFDDSNRDSIHDFIGPPSAK